MKRTGKISATPNPIIISGQTRVGVTKLVWSCAGAQEVEVRIGAPDGPLFSRSGASGQATTGEWVTDGMTFHLQDVSGRRPLLPEHTLATVTVGVKMDRVVRGLILMYHRIAELDADPWSLSVAPGNFAEQLAVLRRAGQPAPLARALVEMDLERETDPLLVVTFDDGYADNLYQALPLLEEFRIPATVFVPVNYIGGRRFFWWDVLDLLLAAADLPSEFRLRIAGANYRWRLDEPAPRQPRRWQASEMPPETARERFYLDLYRLLRPLPEDERSEVIDELLAWAGLASAPSDPYRQMSLDELRRLARHPLIEIGSHALTHRDLPDLSPNTQRDEIERSRTLLSRILGHPVRSFCYPYGSFTAETAQMVRDAGYACACGHFVQPLAAGADPYQLPRVMVGNWNGEEFARRLSAWLRP
ncbi:MAG: polysaccharide deacetylase family protein [Blastocatellales bacterium]|nr:polysaccharide deacetylase family protein [Blastocatellales bacterium]